MLTWSFETKDPDGDEMIVATIFSYRQSSIITKRALEQELATKARHLMRKDVNAVFAENGHGWQLEDS